LEERASSIFSSEDGGSRSHLNIGKMSHYMMSHPR
jgi:hypothetical protein